MKKIIRSFILIFVLIALGAGAFLFYRYQRALPLTYTSGAYPEGIAALENPYCGFYRIYAYRLNGTLPDENTLSSSIEKAPGRLALLQFNLRDWPNENISEAGLSQLDYILSAWASSDKQLILRFLYDWDGKAEETEPADITVIQAHMKQTAEIYNRYADHIFLLQGLYTGNYGEMHHSHHQSTEAIASLASTLYDVSDASIYLGVRTPNQWRTISEQTSGKLDERLSLFNDGLLASSSDAGTYADQERSTEIAFQNELCQTVPNGGEVIISNPYNDLENAVSDFSQMHISYLNMDYDADVLNKWKETSYPGEDIFQGLNGYEYMETHLGYRFVLRESNFAFPSQDSDHATLDISLENVGFSANYIPFLQEITLCGKNSGARYIFYLKYPVIPAGKTAVLSLELPVRSMEPDSYDIYLKTRDSLSSEMILYGNELSPSPDGYYIGILTFEEKSIWDAVKDIF